MVDVDPEDLAEQGREILAILVRVVGGASVPVRDVEEAVRAEDDGPPVVVPVGLLVAEEFHLGRRVGPVGIILADLEPRDDVRQPLRLRRVEDEEIPVLLESGMEREPQEALLVGLVLVGHPVLDVEEDGGAGRLLVVGERVDHAVLGGDEDAVRAIAGMGQHDRPQGMDPAVLRLPLPAGPLQVGERHVGLQREGPLVDLGPGDRGRHGGDRPAAHVGDQESRCGGVDDEIGRVRESLSQEHGPVTRSRDPEDASAPPVAHEEPSELVPGEPVRGTEAFGDRLDRAIGQLDPVEHSRPEIGEQEMVRPVEEHAVRRVKTREPLLVQDQTHGPLRRDPVDRPILTLAVPRIADIEHAGLQIDVQVVEKQGWRGERRSGGEDLGLARFIDPPDPLLVGHEEPSLESDEPLRVIEARCEGHDFAIFDLHDGPIAVAVTLADDRDEHLALGIQHHRFRIRQARDEGLRRLLSPRPRDGDADDQGQTEQIPHRESSWD